MTDSQDKARDELFAKVEQVVLGESPSMIHSVAEHLIASCILQNARDWNQAGEILITSKQTIGRLIEMNWNFETKP